MIEIEYSSSSWAFPIPLYSLFSVIFFVTGTTFTDPLTCSVMILSFFVTHAIESTNNTFSLMRRRKVALLIDFKMKP